MTTATNERPSCHCGEPAVLVIRIKPHNGPPRLKNQPAGHEPYDQPTCQRHVVETCRAGTVLSQTALKIR